MYKDTRSQVAALARDLAQEIKHLENELAGKKDLLHSLQKLEKPAVKRGRKPAVAEALPKTRKSKGTRRKSKNRDAVLAAASGLSGKFTLATLREAIQKKDASFGGVQPSGTILAIIKTTPEIKKVKRGLYTYKG